MKNVIRYSIIFCLTGYLYIQCTETKRMDRKTFYDTSVHVDQDNYPLDSLQRYFPEIGPEDSIAPEGSEKYSGIYLNDSHIDSFCNAWYSAQLYGMHEPLLYNKPIEKEVVRFTWLRSFHHPVSIRMEKENEKYTLYWKVCDGAGEFVPGNLIINRTKIVSLYQWEILNYHLDKAGFWSSGFKVRYPGTDGSEWIFEAAGPDYYQVKSVYLGEEFRPAGEYLLSLTDLKIPREKMY